MKKTIIIGFILLYLSSPAYSGIFGIDFFGKKKTQLMEALQENNVEIKEQNTKIDSLAKVVADIKLSVDSNVQSGANLNAQLGLINKTLNNTVNSGRDSTNVVNDINMDLVIKYGCWVLIGSLMFNFIQILMVIHQFGRARDFKRSYVDSKEIIKKIK